MYIKLDSIKSINNKSNFRLCYCGYYVARFCEKISTGEIYYITLTNKYLIYMLNYVLPNKKMKQTYLKNPKLLITQFNNI